MEKIMRPGHELIFFRPVVLLANLFKNFGCCLLSLNAGLIQLLHAAWSSDACMGQNFSGNNLIHILPAALPELCDKPFRAYE